jgi:hypothetical protein
MNYKAIVRNTNPRAYTGGYKNVAFMAALIDILALSKPADPAVNIGDAVKITAAHTFTDPKGWIPWDCKTNGVTGVLATTGDPGAQECEYSYKITLLGDDEFMQDMRNRVLNDHVIWLLKEANCLEQDKYVQLGDECVAPSYQAEGDFKTTDNGMKEWTLTIKTKAKYFYTGAITMSTDVEV